MRLSKFFFLLLVFSFILSPAVISAQSKGKILIASEKTRFKSLLVAELDSLFTSAGYSTTIVENSKKDLEKQSSANYDGVFITNSGVNSRVRPWVLTWLDRNHRSGTYILLHTTQIRDWETEVAVDAVTSASSRADVEDLAQDYFQRMMRELEKNK